MASRLRSADRLPGVLPYSSPSAVGYGAGRGEEGERPVGLFLRQTGVLGSLKWLLSRLSAKAMLRLVAVVVLLEVGLHFTQISPQLVQLGRRSQCVRYDGSKPPGLFRIWGQDFNYSHVPPASALLHGHGVVMAASGNITRQAVGAFVTAFVLRRVLKSDVPITIYYSGESEAFTGPVRRALDGLQPPVNLTDLSALLGQQGLMPSRGGAVLRSYAAKVYALLASPYRETILLDAGAVPFVGPERLLQLPSYAQHGLAIFSDYVDIDRGQWANVLRQLCLDYGTVHAAFGGRELDSSCVVIDKGRNLDALLVAVALNGELQDHVYSELIGDKDTFGLAMLHVGKTFSVADLEPGYLLLEREQGKARKVSGHLQFLRVKEEGGHHRLEPVHHNNQLLDFREFPRVSNRTHMQVFSVLGDVLMPVNRRRDCRPFPPEQLLPLPPHVSATYQAIAQGLAQASLDHCACRDDWISCEQENARRRRKQWIYALIDLLSPRARLQGFIEPLPPGTLGAATT